MASDHAKLDPVHHVLDTAWLGPITKHQILMVVAAVLVAVPCILLAKRIRNGELPKGPFWNFLEMILIYLREEIAKPNIGEHEADRYVPLLWTLFLFILVCNLLGLIPFLGSPTSEISVTLVLAAIVFLVIHISAIAKLGIGHYLMSYVPKLQADNLAMKLFMTVLIIPMITVIEVLSALIRAAVLAIRLFANIFAGHVTLGVVLLFAVGASGGINWGGGIFAVLMGTALSALELFVAFLQAFVFTLLTAIFLGMQLHPEH